MEPAPPRPFTSGPGLLHIPPKTEPTSVYVKNHGGSDLLRPFTSVPGLHVTHNSGSSRPFDVTVNEIGSATAAATLRGPAYLPPDKSPTPDTNSPDILPPHFPTVTTRRPETTKYTPPSTPRVTYTTPTTSKPVYTTLKNFIPPRYPEEGLTDPQIPYDSIRNEDRLRLPTNTPTAPSTEYSKKGELNTTPYPGCAAALKCVESQFCTADAVISTVPVILSKEQEIMRVPTTVRIITFINIYY